MLDVQLTRKDQQYEDNTRYYALSRWAECSTLRTPYDGPYRLRLWPGISLAVIASLSSGISYSRSDRIVMVIIAI